MKLSNKGFTLAELMIAAGILVVVFASLLAVFVNCILLNELNRNLTLAFSAAETRMEQIKNTAFANLCSFNGENIALNELNDGRRRVEVTDEGSGACTSNSTLKRVRITVCFMNRNRLIGWPDINSCTASPVELVTLLAE